MSRKERGKGRVRGKDVYFCPTRPARRLGRWRRRQRPLPLTGRGRVGSYRLKEGARVRGSGYPANKDDGSMYVPHVVTNTRRNRWGHIGRPVPRVDCACSCPPGSGRIDRLVPLLDHAARDRRSRNTMASDVWRARPEHSGSSSGPMARGHGPDELAKMLLRARSTAH